MTDSVWGGPAAEVVNGPAADVFSGSAGGVAGGVTLVEGSAFCISRGGGDIARGGTQGLYYRDTRFLSRFELLVDDEPPIPLAFHQWRPDEGLFLGMMVRGSDSPRILVERHRRVGLGMRECITLRNMDPRPTSCQVELLCDADFADLFEVKEARIRKEGFLGSGPSDGGLYFRYQRGKFQRGLDIRFQPEPQLAHREAVFDVHLGPRDKAEIDIEFRPVLGRTVVSPARKHHPTAAPDPLARDAWLARQPHLDATVPTWRRLLRRSVDDLGALRIRDPENPEQAVFAAGIPWFMTLFGRDSIIAAWQALVLDPDSSLTTLAVLARHQGMTDDPATGETPGKILHEMRFGERADPALGGRQIYYGTVDATPLFVMLAGQLLRFGASAEELSRVMPAVEEALNWMSRWGDLDGDGFIEYPTDPSAFLWNQGWKDSRDAIAFPDGTIATGPIALVEVQGYAYAAYLAAAELRQHLGTGNPDELRIRAARLKDAVVRQFRTDDGFFAVALDGDNRRVDAVTSNPGHLLWTGILDADDAAAVARRLLEPDCWSGFGIRTLSRQMASYNPLSYHNGSVWPHDNALIVAGMLRYGLVEEASQVTAGLLRSAPFFGARLPELFGGFSDHEYPFPVPYPTACSPQAWAAGAPLLALRAFLGLEPELHQGRLRLRSRLPEGLRVEIGGMNLGGGRLSLRADGTDVDVLEAPPGVDVFIE